MMANTTKENVEGEIDALEDNTCQKAPEWAEHARFSDEDDACDDGRSGQLRTPVVQLLKCCEVDTLC